MKNGQVKVWWFSNGLKTIDEEVDTVLDGLWILHTQSVLEVDNDNIDCNMGGLSYFNEEYLKEEYDCEDGMSDVFCEYGDDIKEVNDLVVEELGIQFQLLTKEQIKEYIIKNKVKAEDDRIKMY